MSVSPRLRLFDIYTFTSTGASSEYSPNKCSNVSAVGCLHSSRSVCSFLCKQAPTPYTDVFEDRHKNLPGRLSNLLRSKPSHRRASRTSHSIAQSNRSGQHHLFENFECSYCRNFEARRQSQTVASSFTHPGETFSSVGIMISGGVCTSGMLRRMENLVLKSTVCRGESARRHNELV